MWSRRKSKEWKKIRKISPIYLPFISLFLRFLFYLFFAYECFLILYNIIVPTPKPSTKPNRTLFYHKQYSDLSKFWFSFFFFAKVEFDMKFDKISILFVPQFHFLQFSFKEEWWKEVMVVLKLFLRAHNMIHQEKFCLCIHRSLYCKIVKKYKFI